MMPNEYITRSAVESLIKKSLAKRPDLANWFLAKLAELPTADVIEATHGTWVHDLKVDGYYCNRCHYWDLRRPRYCPNCLAMMDGGVSENEFVSSF